MFSNVSIISNVIFMMAKLRIYDKTLEYMLRDIYLLDSVVTETFSRNF